MVICYVFCRCYLDGYVNYFFVLIDKGNVLCDVYF